VVERRFIVLSEGGFLMLTSLVLVHFGRQVVFLSALFCVLLAALFLWKGGVASVFIPVLPLCVAVACSVVAWRVLGRSPLLAESVPFWSLTLAWGLALAFGAVVVLVLRRFVPL